MARLEVQVEALREALARLKKTGGKGRTPPPCAWTFAPDSLTVEWGGVLEKLEGRGEGRAVAYIATKLMRRIVDALPSGPAVVISLSPGRMHLGSISFPVDVRSIPAKPRGGPAHASPPELIAPMYASDVELMLIPYRYKPADIEWSRHGNRVANATAKKERAIRDAADALARLEISEAQVRDFVERYLRRRAGVPEQGDLFG